MGWRGLLAGALGLAFLELVVSNPAASGRLGSAATGIGDVVRRFLSPAVPLFSPAAPKSSSSSTTPAPATPAPAYPSPNGFPKGTLT